MGFRPPCAAGLRRSPLSTLPISASFLLRSSPWGIPYKLLVVSLIDKEFNVVYLVCQTPGQPLPSESDLWNATLRNTELSVLCFSEIHAQLGFKRKVQERIGMWYVFRAPLNEQRDA